MTRLHEVNPLIADAARVLGRHEHVLGVGIGDREVADEVVGEMSLKVFVDRKVGRAELSRDDLLPRGLGDLRIDVTSVDGMRRRADGEIVPQPINDEEMVYQPQEGKPPIARQTMRSGRHGVLEGGMGLSAGYGSGTIGCFLEDQHSDDVYALTNDHVLRNVARGRTLEPGRTVGSSNRVGVFNFCCTRTIGTVHVSTEYTWTSNPFGIDEDDDGDPDRWSPGVILPDAGVVKLDDGVRYSPTIHHVGPIYGVRDLMSPDFVVEDLLNQRFQVLKRGRTTGTTGGFVIAIGTVASETSGVEIPADHVINGMITIRPNGPTAAAARRWFIASGDSGSVSIDLYGNVVALNHSSRDAQYGGTAMATPIKTVLDWLPPAFESDGHDRPVLHVAAHRSCDDIVRTAGDATAHVRDEQLGLDALVAVGVGREIGRVWDQHSGEILHLVNTNRHVGTVWQRSGVLQVVQHLLRIGADPDRRMPTSIDGRDPQACVDRFADELVRWGSPPLVRSIDELRDRLPELAGRSHAEVLMQLERAG